ncbi:MAG: hypothetical protein EAZ64_08875 [Sphingobacteriales bacterium]|nr:MAG: hypothetical protein EAZ64_08875 [Sphingobacteriales bacterium]
MLEVLQQYKSLKDRFNEILALSGYRLDFLAKELNMQKNTMSAKKQRNSFTDDEMYKLLTIVWNERTEDKFLHQAMKEAEKDGLMSQNDITKMLDECK